jgi:exodeoxyribonuclease VII large subunit
MQKDQAFSVSQISEYIKMTLETNPVLRDVWMRGEISNFKSNFSSGHLYFSLKDESSTIRAVMFRGYSARLKFRPESGMKVLVHGKISTYTPSGDYQIILDEMQPDGEGELALAFEQLKRRLESEGLFDPARKKAIPKYVKRVGVITSASGAALHDIINVSGRRCPMADIVIYPAFVQGDMAPRSLASGIKFFNDREAVDLIIIGRGGGSMEDLWGFNDENLARVIAASEIPVISAVGHETDFTICDFVADLRAPTPSAAAEIAFFDAREVKDKISYLRHKADTSVSRRLIYLENRLDILKKSAELHSPIGALEEKRVRLERLGEKLQREIENKIDNNENRFKMLITRLEGANPLTLLTHGYAMAQNSAGEVITSVSEANIGDRIEITLSDGKICADVVDIEVQNG